MIIDELAEILRQRRGADPESSYVASLYDAGLDKILQKVGEEATEVIIAAKDADPAQTNEPAARQELVKEVADLWFHSMVLLTHVDLGPQDVLDELARRFGVGGHDEKAARK